MPDSESKKEKLKVLVDLRERNLELLEALKKHGIEPEFAQLPVGDYIISDRIAVERKTFRDLQSSIINSRLFDQLDRLSASYPKPFLIIEGSDEEFALAPNVLLGTIVSAFVDHGVEVIRSSSPEETAELIAKIAEHEKEEKREEPRAVGMKRAYTLAQWQMLVLRSLPGVGNKLARSLLGHFGSIRNIAMAKPEELMEVEKIGEKKAELIHHILNAEFEESANNDPV